MSKIKEQIFFLRRLSFLLSSGHPIYTSLELLSVSGEVKKEGELQNLISWVSSGKSFSSGIATHKMITDTFACQLILLGEKTSTLPHMVGEAAKELERKKLFQGKLIGSLLYPFCVLGGTLLVGLSLVFFVFPKVVPVFGSLGVSLPLSTRLLIGSITFSVSYWWLILPILFGLGYYTWRLSRPYFWKLSFIRSLWLAQFFRVMNLLLASGVPIDQCILFCAELSKEEKYIKTLTYFYKEISHGRNLMELCRDTQELFPPLIYGFIAASEKSGTLVAAFEYLSDFYIKEVESFLTKATELVEPALMVILGLGVGFIGMALLGPIYGITSHVYQ